jgi:hypothetical protein
VTATTAPVAAPQPETREARFGPRQREVRAALELFALSGIAVAQPTFDLLGKNTGIFATRGATSLDLILLALFIVIVPPLVLYVVEVLVGLVLPRLRRYVHALLCGLAFGVFVEEILKRTTDLAPVRLVHLGWIAGLLAALAFLRLEWMRVWLRFLAIAPVLFALLFLFGSPASAIVTGGEAKAKSGVVLETPKRVVMVVFDEFPEMSLMNGSGGIDQEQFPNFAELAASSTWYRNDTTVAPYTERAVPAILTGRLPPTGTVVPSVDDYPQNLFTMLGGALPFNVHEAVTALCPKSLCAARANDSTGMERLTDLGTDAYHLWRDFASPHASSVNFSESSVVQWGLPQQRNFVRSLQPGKGPRLDFVHVELPHEPWHLLSTLQDTNNLAPQQGASKLEWQRDDWPAESARRQHLLQVQATDTVLGQITKKLKSIGAWDDSMVVVTADHGVAFSPLEGIRSVTDQAGGNYQQILWTPLFVKYPGQATGKVDDRPAQSIDIVPTVAQVLGTKVPWKIDGTSLLGPVRKDFPRKFDQTRGQSFAAEHSLYPPDGQRYLELSPKGFQDVIASRAVPATGGDPKLRIYRIGPYADLVGTSVSQYQVAPVSRPTLAHVGGQLVSQIRGSPAPSYDLLDPTAKDVPWTYFLGLLDNLDDDQWVAIALNGKIVGLGQALPLQGTTTGILSTVLAPQLVTRGANTLTLYALSGDPGAPQLRDVPVFRGPGE